MGNEFNAMGKNQINLLWSAMGYALSNADEFKEQWNISDEQWGEFYPIFSELADAAGYHGIMK